MVLDRSAGLLPGVRDVAEILIVSDTISVGKGLKNEAGRPHKNLWLACGQAKNYLRA